MSVYLDLKQLVEGRAAVPGIDSDKLAQALNSLFADLGVSVSNTKQSTPVEDKKSSEEAFQALVAQAKSNDPKLTAVNTQFIPMDDERTIQLFQALENNKHVTSIAIRGQGGTVKFTDKACPYIKHYLANTKTLKSLKLCHNQMDEAGALHLMAGIFDNDSLTDICICHNPMLNKPMTAAALCMALEKKPKLLAGMKESLLHFLKNRLPEKHQRPLSQTGLLEYITKNPKGFVTLYGHAGCHSHSKSSKPGAYSEMSECYCVPQMSRFLDSPNAPDYRKASEQMIVDYYCQKYPDKKVVLKFVSVGAGSLMQDAVVIAKLYAAGFRHFNWSMVDLDFNNVHPLLHSKTNDITTFYQFMQLMQDLGLRVTNGNLAQRNTIMQDLAFELFKQRTSPLKRPKGNICITSYDSVSSYCAAVSKNPRNAPHALITLDLNDSVPDGIVGQIKKMAAEGTLHFNMEKNFDVHHKGTKGVARIEVQRKIKGQWKPAINPARYITALPFSDLTSFPLGYYDRHRDSYKVTLRKPGDLRVAEQHNILPDVSSCEHKVEKDKPKTADSHTAAARAAAAPSQGPGFKSTLAESAALRRARARASAAMDGSKATNTVFYSTAPGEAHQVFTHNTVFYSTAPGEDHRVFVGTLDSFREVVADESLGREKCAEVKRQAEELNDVDVSHPAAAGRSVDQPFYSFASGHTRTKASEARPAHALATGQPPRHKRRNSWSA